MKIYPFLFPLFCFLLALPAMASLQTFQGETMGTVWNVSIVTEIQTLEAPSVQKTIEETLQKVDYRMSTWKNFTELSRINQTEDVTEPIPLSPEMAMVLQAALEVSAKTNGAYDITVGPLVNLWKFGPDKENAPEVPTDPEIAEVRKKIGWQNLTLRDDSTLKLAKPGLYLDLSSIAKGYAVDETARTLESLGIENYMVEVGGEVRTRGKNVQDVPWRIGIETPIPNTTLLLGSVQPGNGALATSGDYRNFRMEGDKRRSHILDPRTGRPVAHKLVSVSVRAPDCMTADAWATALMVLGPDEGIETARREKLSALFLVQDGERLVPTSVNFTWAACSSAEAPLSTDNLTRRFLIPALVGVVLFLFFFFAVGMSQLLGRRKMRCSCSAARAMEKERTQIIQRIKNLNEENKDGFR